MTMLIMRQETWGRDPVLDGTWDRAELWQCHCRRGRFCLHQFQYRIYRPEKLNPWAKHWILMSISMDMRNPN